MVLSLIHISTITNAGDGLITEAEVEYGADLQAFALENYTNFITGKTSLDEWDKFVEEWNLSLIHI